jgi:large subunit ribosomal protein L3
VALEFLCRKIGMTQLFTETGENIPVTVLEAAPNRVIQVKTVEKDGYSALQLGYGERRPSRTSKAAVGHCQKANAGPQQILRESRLPAEEVAKYAPGQEIKCDVFSPGQRVDLIGTSKGRGTAGVVKRHHFTISNASHGTHEDFRHAGSIGPGSFPGRVIKGLRMAGRMGNERVTTQNVEVVRVDAERGLLYVRGGVPGHPNAFLRLRSSVKA